MDPSTTPLDSLHGWGLLAALGAAVAMLAVADRAWRPAASVLRDAACTAAGAALMLGAALFGSGGGFPVGSDVGGASRVTLGPGLPLAGAAGLLLAGLSGALLVSRRGVSRRPGRGAGR